MPLPELIALLAVVALAVDLAAAVATEQLPAPARARIQLVRAAWAVTGALCLLVVVRFATALA